MRGGVNASMQICGTTSFLFKTAQPSSRQANPYTSPNDSRGSSPRTMRNVVPIGRNCSPCSSDEAAGLAPGASISATPG